MSDGVVVENFTDHPLDFLYGYFSERIEQLRQEPRGDVLTGMARATFPDGSTPEPVDVARIAANLFSAGQETTVRLLSTALRLIGDEPGLPLEARFYQRLLAHDQDEARHIAEIYLKEKPLGSFYDSVLIPALALAEQDRHPNSLAAETASESLCACRTDSYSRMPLIGST